jgi:uncharacterized protein
MPVFVNILGALMLTGVAGSVGHCIGMCGPLLILAGARYPKKGVSSIPYHVIYHLGRILVYAILGIISGALGGVIGKLAVAAKIPGAVSLIIGAFIILLALSNLGWLPFWKRSIENNGWWQRMLKSVMKTPGAKAVLILGMLNGILPCGLVYESLLIAGTLGNPWLGGLGMFLFGLATLPVLVLFGFGAQMISLPVRKWLFWAGGVFILLVGIILILRGVSGLGLGFPQFT